jgi:hypothetical protein
LNVKQISTAGDQYPVVTVHSLADARSVLAHGWPVTLLSAEGAALFAGCGWWRALIDRVRGEYAAVPISDILDCADASGLALGALRIGQRAIVLSPSAPGWAAVAAIAASLGAEVFTRRPDAIDMSRRAEVRRLRDWLRPGDSGQVVS